MKLFIALPSGTVVYVINGLDDGTDNIYFPEKTISGSTYNLKEYVALPIEISGIETNGTGSANRPTLVLAFNVPSLTRSITNNDDSRKDEETLPGY